MYRYIDTVPRLGGGSEEWWGDLGQKFPGVGCRMELGRAGRGSVRLINPFDSVSTGYTDLTVGQGICYNYLFAFSRVNFDN